MHAPNKQSHFFENGNAEVRLGGSWIIDANEGVGSPSECCKFQTATG